MAGSYTWRVRAMHRHLHKFCCAKSGTESLGIQLRPDVGVLGRARHALERGVERLDINDKEAWGAPNVNLTGHVAGKSRP